MFLEKYGWFVILGVVLHALIWSNFEPYWRKWKKKREKQYEETIGKIYAINSNLRAPAYRNFWWGLGIKYTLYCIYKANLTYCIL